MKLAELLQRVQVNKLTEIIINFDTIDDLRGQQFATILSQNHHIEKLGLYNHTTIS